VEKRVMAFGAKLSALVKEHFGAVRPILDEEPGRSKRMRSNVEVRGGDTGRAASTEDAISRPLH